MRVVLVTTLVILVPVLTSLFLLTRQAALFLQWMTTQPVVGPEELAQFWDRLPERYPTLEEWIAYVQAQGDMQAAALDYQRLLASTTDRALCHRAAERLDALSHASEPH